MSPPEDLVPERLEHLGAEPLDDIESEPRQRWRPKEELLRALEEARRDLRPGETALYWDWTRTRDSAPEAEDMRPSGEGEVLVSDKEAAAAYVAPKEVAPCAAPRPLTKSRIRVREDVDPRRAPTVRNAREQAPTTLAKHRIAGALHRRSPPSGSHRLKRPAPPQAQEDAPAAPLISTEAGLELGPPVLGPERRRRVTWAFFFGMVTGVIVFFWLRFPGDPARSSHLGAPAAPSSASAPMLRYGPSHWPAPAVFRDEAQTAESGAAEPAPIAPPGQRAPETAEPPRPEQGRGSAPRSNTGSVQSTPGGAGQSGAPRAPAQGTSDPAAKAPSGGAGETLSPRPGAAPEPRPGGFLIRKKGL